MIRKARAQLEDVDLGVSSVKSYRHIVISCSHTVPLQKFADANLEELLVQDGCKIMQSLCFYCVYIYIII